MLETSPIAITLPEARALAIAAQELDRISVRRPDSAAILRLIEHLGVLQIDTINVIERSQYLVLWSRLGAYDPALLDALLFPGRQVFECMAPVALIAPMQNYRYYRPRMLRSMEEMWRGWREWATENPTALEETLQAVRERGPLASADFERPPDARRTGPWDWHGPKPSRRALETLYNLGQVMVHSRRGGQKLYDVRERVLAEAFDGQVPDDGDLPDAVARVTFFARHAVEALGVIQPAWLWEYHAVRPESPRGSSRRAEALAALQAMADQGVVVPATIEGLDGPAFIATSLLPRLETLRSSPVAGRTTLLSPFDSLIWDRARTRALFGFDVCFEAYVPPPKRKYGYYCLTILHHNQLVGRIDAKMDRATRCLFVRAAYLEPGVKPGARLVRGVAVALQDLARFLGAGRVEIGTGGSETLGRALAERLAVV